MTPTSNPYDGLIERLRAKKQVTPPLGSGSLATDGTNMAAKMTIWDDGMRLRNPDGPEAAEALSRLTRDVGEAGTDCEFLLSVIDSCDEAEAPSCEMEPEDVANIARIRATLTRLSRPTDLGAAEKVSEA